MDFILTLTDVRVIVITVSICFILDYIRDKKQNNKKDNKDG